MHNYLLMALLLAELILTLGFIRISRTGFTLSLRRKLVRTVPVPLVLIAGFLFRHGISLSTLVFGLVILVAWLLSVLVINRVMSSNGGKDHKLV